MANATNLRENLRGELILEGEQAYATASQLYNRSIQSRPRAIARCRDVADVCAAIQHARANGLRIAVRGGGHSGAGHGSVDGGVVIDLSLMRGVRVDQRAGAVRADGGALIGDVDHATYPFGLAVPAGVVSSTGIAGLTLGGGTGYLTRKYGLTIDNLREADVVLADGRVVTASEREHPDLFWAIRGGGGNFGVVTSFVFSGQPVENVFGGPTFWPVEDTREVMSWYRTLMQRAPEELYAFFMIGSIPPGPPFPSEIHGRRVCGIIWCHLGAEDEARQALAAGRDFKPPLFEMHGLMPLPALNSMFDAVYPPGLQWYWKGHFIREISDDAIAVNAEHGAKLATPMSLMHLYPIDGAAARVSGSATAFAHRDARYSMVIAGVDPDPAKFPSLRGWARDYWQALQPYAASGGYVNFMQDEGDDRVRGTYGTNYARLARIKAEYDPHNVFNVNWNIVPQPAGSRKPADRAPPP